MRYNRTSPDTEARVVAMLNAKRLTPIEIARECGISRRTVFRIAQRNSAPPRPTAGAK